MGCCSQNCHLTATNGVSGVFLCGVCVSSLCLCGFSLVGVRLIGDSKSSLSVNVSVKGCSSLYDGPIIW